MIKWICSTTLVLLFAIMAAAPGYAVAEPPVPDWKHKKVPFDAVLYETTENLKMKALLQQQPRRKATSSLLGFARRGSALCPEALVLAAEPNAKFCTLNATGSDNISLKTGKGTFGGDVEVTVQELVEVRDPVTGDPILDPATNKPILVITPDSPEVVIAKGRFTGKMDFSPAILHSVPLGSVDGFVSLGGFSQSVPFKGEFRLPFLLPPVADVVCQDPNAPLYIVDLGKFMVDPTSGVACVADNEMAIGYPTVRFEITF
jgi:hypothetical protein